MKKAKYPNVKLSGQRIATDVCLFMKIGSHGDERFQEILKRKRLELEKAGLMLWGYAGNLLTPLAVSEYLRKVQPARSRVALLMIETKSPFKNRPVASKAFSIDKENWLPLPESMGTKGCDKALVCKSLFEANLRVDLSDYQVAVGPSKGRSMRDYLTHRTDKACAIYVGKTGSEPESKVKISWAAEVVPPFAIYLSDSLPEQASLFKQNIGDQLGIFTDIL